MQYKLLSIIMCCSISISSQDLPPVLTISGNSQLCPSASGGAFIASSVNITDPDDTTVEEVSVQISNGYVAGQDVLTLTGIYPNIISTWIPDEGRLLLEGPATFDEFETAILSVIFSVNDPSTSGVREVSVVIGNALYLPNTGHYYEFVDNENIRWDDARDAAELRTYFGLQGYLVTLISQEETEFAGGQITGNGWIGATDDTAAGEGVWTWVTGPEAGTVFWNGDENGATVPGGYAFWNTNEPNDYPDDAVDGQENFAHIAAAGIGIPNSWNDLPIGGGGGAYNAKGYIVEYGGSPGDPALQISGVTQVSVGCRVITNRNITFRTSPVNNN